MALIRTIAFLVLLLPTWAQAVDLYVNGATGNDSRTYSQAQNSSTPWATIERCAWGSNDYASPNTSAAAQAGDTCIIAAGTYSVSGRTTYDSASRTSVVLNPANSGTSGSPITFRGVGTVEIRCNSDTYGPTIGAYQRNYIIWDHFTLNGHYQCNQTNNGSAFDHGQVSFDEADHGQIINSTLTGHNGSFANGRAITTGNYSVVWLGDSNGIIVKNNDISRVWGEGTTVGSGTQNDAGVLTYGANSAVIEHNEISDAGTGVFLKGIPEGMTQTDNIVRLNYLHGNGAGVRVLDAHDSIVSQNVVVNDTGAENATGLYAGFGTSLRTLWINNTVYGCVRAITLQDSNDLTGVHFYNNIVASSTYAIYNWPTGSMADLGVSFTRNFYHGNSNHFTGEGLGNVNFATWQGTHSKDVDGSNGVDPQFVNAAGGDWHLASNGQTALTLGRVVNSIGGTNGDTIPVGAYITGSEEIGIESGDDVTPPAAPTGFRLIAKGTPWR